MLNMNNKVKKYIRIIVVVIVLIYLSNLGYKVYIDFKNSSVSFTLPKEYEALFSKSKSRHLKDFFTYNNSVSNPVAAFSFDSAYNIVIFKFTMSKVSSSIIDMVKVKKESSSRPSRKWYSTISQYYELVYVDEPQKSMTNLYLKLNANFIEAVVKNDSVLNYSLSFKDFSVRQLDGSEYIYGASGNGNLFSNNSPVPANILFLKKQKAIYFIILTATDFRKKVDKDVLYKMIRTQ